MSSIPPIKIETAKAPSGSMGQVYLAGGDALAMRLWLDEAPSDPKPPTARDYETVGYVISGRAEVHIEGKAIALKKGDSWVVPKGASHAYRIIETFTAVEATSPPAHLEGRDEI